MVLADLTIARIKNKCLKLINYTLSVVVLSNRAIFSYSYCTH
jgi:hypothetical protein